MPYKEKEIEKLYYTIGEVAQMFQVNTSHIRFWSKEFDVIKPATNKKGNRLYTQADIDNFRKIYHLVKEKGFTLKGAKTELKEQRIRERAGESEPEVPTVIDQPVDQASAMTFAGTLFSGDYVDKMAIRESLNKMRAALLDIDRELDQVLPA
jgi:DNA-binding transcriptional MerR regulator